MAEQRAKERRRREERRAANAQWWRAVWTARARVHQIARLVSGGRWQARYPEVLIVDHSPLLMELLHRQLEAQPLSARCWGSQHALADEAQLVVLVSDIAGRVEDLHRTGHMGREDRGARCVVAGTAEARALPPARIDPVPPLCCRGRGCRREAGGPRGGCRREAGGAAAVRAASPASCPSMAGQATARRCLTSPPDSTSAATARTLTPPSSGDSLVQSSSDSQRYT